MKTPTAKLVVLLELGVGFWLAAAALVPQMSQAYSARDDIAIDRQPNETYENLVRRAEATATAAAQQRFDRDVGVTDVYVVVVGQNQGAIAPVLSLRVSRPQWRSRSDSQQWTTYFTSARALLRFDNVATTSSTQPVTANPATSNYPSQPRTANPSNNNYPGQSGNPNYFPGRRRYPNSYPSQTGTVNPFTPGQSTISYPGQAGIVNPYTSGQPSNSYPGQTGIVNPYTFGQPSNSYPGQTGIVNPFTPGQSTNSYPSQTGIGNPFAPTNQTPAIGSGIVPQQPIAVPVTIPGNR